MKKLLALCLMLLFFNHNSVAQTAVAPSVGDGSESNPYQISTLENLYWISDQVQRGNAFSGIYFSQTQDIDASATASWFGGQGWQPIGASSSRPFSGTYNGNNHVINALTIDRGGYVGLFGYTNGSTIENLGLTNVAVNGIQIVGALVGEHNNSSTLSNCFSIGMVTAGNYVGGLVGRSENGSSITSCYANGYVSGIQQVGGLAATNNRSTITNSSSDSRVEGTSYVGGLLGYNYISTVSKCQSSGSVEGSSTVGGLVGRSYNSSISESYSASDVSGSSSTGGLCGYNLNSPISNSYSSGRVFGSASSIGGLVGVNSSTITNSFWDTENSGQTTSAGGTGKTSAEMKTASTFLSAGWDFKDETANGTEDIWQMGPVYNDGYPAFSWQTASGAAPLLPQGSGTESDPYQISSLENLYWISDEVQSGRSFSGTVFKQMVNLSAASTFGWFSGKGWQPIGNESTQFAGTYKGNSTYITGLYIDRPSEEHMGLFGYCENASIENLGVVQSRIIGGAYCAGLVGSLKNSDISQCYSSGSISGAAAVGGMCGKTTNTASITASFSSCSVNGTLDVGGLVGAHTNSTISNSYNQGAVNGGSTAGGLCGKTENATVFHSYSNGLVSGSGNVGGLIGSTSGSTVTHSFWDTDSSRQASSAAGTGKTAAEMKDPLTYFLVDWDFTDETINGSSNYWTMDFNEHNGYPALHWQGFENMFQEPAGSGASVGDPYLISSLKNLCWLSFAVKKGNSFNGYFFKQTSQINASSTSAWFGGKGWLPVGNSVTKFSGAYNGNGQLISGLTINRPLENLVGFFGYADQATIENLGLTSVAVTGKDSTGGVVGYMENTSILGCFSTGSLVGGASVGGIAGIGATNSSLSNSYAMASVSADSVAGGLCGNMANSTIIHSYSAGSVSGTTDVGGLIGSLSSSTITNSYWDTETSGQSISAGGTGKTSARMKDIFTYFLKGWDFKDESLNGSNDYWTIHSTANSGYPALTWQGLSNSFVFTPQGSGSKAEPYLISTLAHLYWMSVEVQGGNTFNGAYFKQTAHINASSTSDWFEGVGWQPIGSSSTTFSGMYNGNGHTIDGLYIYRPAENNIGLFGEIVATRIENLGLLNLDITGASNVGGLVGHNGNSTIENCYVSGSIIGHDRVGGLVGWNYTGTVLDEITTKFVVFNDTHSMVSNSYASVSVSGNEVVGGLVGFSYYSTIEYSYATGSVSGSSYTGGLVGELNGGNVQNSFWDTETSGQSTSAGGAGKTTTEMKTALTFLLAGWDFKYEVGNGTADTWTIHGTDNSGYPALTWQGLRNNVSLAPEGEGSQANPYLISSLEDLYWIAVQVQLGQNFSGNYFLQTQTIDASSTSGWFNGAGWKPIGEGSSLRFSATYYGNHHAIKGLYIHRPSSDYMGLFGYARDATIKDLSLDSVLVTGREYNGGLVGYLYESTITNCNSQGIVNGISSYTGGLIGYMYRSTISDSYTTGSVHGISRTGGLVGFSNSSNISHCYSTDSVFAASNYTGGLVGQSSQSTLSYCYSAGYVKSTSYHAGGIVGSNFSNSTIEHSYSRSEVQGLYYVGGLAGTSYNNTTITNSQSSCSIQGERYVGGIAGQNNQQASIINCNNTGYVNGRDYTGGLVGYNNNSSTIITSYNNGAVEGRSYIGGLIGQSRNGSVSNCYNSGKVSATNSYAGGLVGFNYSASNITNCFSTGQVNGSLNLGGLVGYNLTSTITNSFWDTETSGLETSAGGVGKTTAKMHSLATFTDTDSLGLDLAWDFLDNPNDDAGNDDHWDFNSAIGGYPYLAWQRSHMATILSGNTAQHMFPAAGIALQFTIGNTGDIELNISRIDSMPSIVGSLPSGVLNLSQRYWSATVDSGIADGTYNIIIDISGLNGIDNCTSLKVLKRADSSSAWLDVETLGGTLVYDCPNTITVIGLTGFSDFVIGGGSDNPLPVELAGFSGNSTSSGIELNWTTQTETNNAGFVLHRNGIEIASYENTEALKGHSTSSQKQTYGFVDADVSLDETYTYKLLSVDYSGQRHSYNQTIEVRVTEAIEPQKPYEYALHQNYPNPFNPATTINFVMKKAGQASLKVYDVLGRVVLSELIEAERGPNVYNFNGQNYSSGVYFYQLNTEGFSKTLKMMLVK